MNLRRTRTIGQVVLIAATLWFLPSPSPGREPAQKLAAKPAARRTVHHKLSSRRTSNRRTSYRSRLAKMQPEPERIQEIQQALIREGYLTQEPTGKWDDATRAAMRRYQEANGFTVTGLPEAKTLMKLGLGPHPLAQDADPRVVGSASISPAAKPDAPPAPGTNGSPHADPPPNEK